MQYGFDIPFIITQSGLKCQKPCPIFNIIMRQIALNFWTRDFYTIERRLNKMLKIGSHVGMKGKEMMFGSAKEAYSYGANTFMIFTGAPQNTKRKPIAELKIDKAWEFMDDSWHYGAGCPCPLYH